MLIIFIGILLGSLSGLLLKNLLMIDLQYTIYVFLILLALVNTLLEVVSKKNIEDFKIKYCTLHMFFDIMLAIVFSFISDVLYLPLYLIIIFAFGNKMYRNFVMIVDNYFERKNI